MFIFTLVYYCPVFSYISEILFPHFSHLVIKYVVGYVFSEMKFMFLLVFMIKSKLLTTTLFELPDDTNIGLTNCVPRKQEPG